MPRPSNGYSLLDGTPVPGVHDVTSRYKDSNGLLYWKWQQGKEGFAYRTPEVFEIGHAVHRMAELDLRGAPEHEVLAVPNEKLSTPADRRIALNCFAQYQAWRRQHDIRPISLEESIVSERMQYGGTLDLVAWVDGVISKTDFKTCSDASKVYLDQRIALAAYGNLWHEKYPDQPIEAYHLINLQKDGSIFRVHSFSNLDAEWHMFALQLECWRLEKGLTKKASVKRATAAPAKKAAKAETPKAEPPKPNRTSKLYVIAAEPETAAVVEHRPDAMAELRDFAGVYPNPNIKPVPAPVDALRDLREITRHARTAKVK